MNQALFKIDPSNLKPLPPRDNHNCFGCSPRNEIGLQMKFHAGDDAMYSFLTVPGHLGGWSNIAHGGIVTTIMDEIMAWATIYFLHHMVMTKNIQIEFLKPVPIGKPITAKGIVLEQISKREARMQGEIFNESGELCARATGNFALFTAEAIVRLGIMDKKTIDEFQVYFQKHTTTQTLND